jgi:hypothetical protein
MRMMMMRVMKLMMITGVVLIKQIGSQQCESIDIDHRSGGG